MRDPAAPHAGPGAGGAILFGALLLPFGYAAGFGFPFGDDFARAVLARGLFDWVGGLHDMVWNWQHWSGRYTHHFMAVFLGDAVLGRAGYAAVCLAVLALYGAAAFGIVSEVAGAARLRDRIGLALAALATLCAGHGALDVTHYVVTDALALGLGNALVLAHVWALCRLWHRPAAGRGATALAAGTAVLAVGCYEHAAIATVVASVLAAWMAHRSGHPRRRAFLAVAGAAMASGLLSFLAPGNFGRQRIRDVTRDRIAAQLLGAGEDWLVVAAGGFASHFALFAALLGLWLAPAAHPGFAPVPRSRMAVAGMLAFVAVSAGIVLVHALSDVRVTDTRKLPASAQLLLGIVLAYVAVASAGPLRARAAALPAWTRSVLPALALFAVLAASDNTRRVLASIASGALQAHARTMERRLEVLAAEKRADLEVAPLSACPYPACVGDPVPAIASAWPAAHIARLYGERSVRVAAPDPGRAYADASSSSVPPAWTRLADSGLSAAAAFVQPGPNATYRDAWLFLRVPENDAAPRAAVAFRQPDALADTVRRLQLVRLERGAAAPRLFGAPLGIADDAGIPSVELAVDGAAPVRVPLRAR